MEIQSKSPNKSTPTAELRILVIAEAANPEWVSVPLVGWSLANALRVTVSAHIVTQIRNREAIERAGLIEGKDFTAIDSEKVAKPLWRIGNFIRGASGKAWTIGTALNSIAYYYFEHLIWRRFGAAISAGEYDIVHRVTPLSPTTQSLLAAKCRKAGVPFVLGPLNGGVPWPKAFDSARRDENEWLSYLRGAYKLLPGYRSTLKSSSAIIVGSKDTLAQIPASFHDKCVYIPENAVDPVKFSAVAPTESVGPLRICFVGRLVPYKGADMLLEAIAPVLLKGGAVLDVIGDGPLMSRLKGMVEEHGIQASVNLHGWVEHGEVQNIMCQSRLLAFPSIREFGGGVVLEAMALGIVPLVVDYAGPGELVSDDIGFKIPIGTREEIVDSLRRKLTEIVSDPSVLLEKSVNSKTQVKNNFSWTAKASQVAEIYRWVLKHNNEKPRFFN